jgi:adenylate cyclase
LAVSHYLEGNYSVAVEIARRSVRQFPKYPAMLPWLAAGLGQLGKHDEARAVIQSLSAMLPSSLDAYIEQRLALARHEDHEHILEGLRKAGWQRPA